MAKVTRRETDKLPDGWRWVTLGDVAVERQEFERNAESAGFERYLKVEHLDADSLRIARWGNIADGDLPPTFYKVFRAGQVLYPTRNPHLRRTAYADFDGICGEKTLTLEAKPEIDSKLLPFIFQRADFIEHATTHMIGSTNPHIRWRDVAAFRFALPPLDEQRHIAEILWAIDEVIITKQEVLSHLETLKSIYAEQLCWQRKELRLRLVELVKDTTGKLLDGDWIESKNMSANGFRLIQLADIGSGRFLDKSSRFITAETFERLGCTEVFPGDILVARMAEPIGRACIVPDLGERFLTAVDCTIIRLNPARHIKEYWCNLFNTITWNKKVEGLAGGSTRTRISRTNLESIEVPVPAIGEQESAVYTLNMLDDAIDQLAKVLINISNVKTTFSQACFRMDSLNRKSEKLNEVNTAERLSS